MEVMIVVAILGIVCLIAIPSVASLSESLTVQQNDEHAKAIFMAAQANLTKMRSEGTLSQLQSGDEENFPAANDSSRFPEGAGNTAKYVYVTSGESNAAIYDIVLPEHSVEDILRDQAVIIEYNPFTGNVYSVFYSEDITILENYRTSGLPRDNADIRKELALGYHEGSLTDMGSLATSTSNVTVTCKNGDDFTVSVKVTVPWEDYEKYYAPDAFWSGLSVSLTVIGESEESGSFVLELMDHGTTPDYVTESGDRVTHIILTVPLDTAKDINDNGKHYRFANYAAGDHNTDAKNLPADACKIKPGDNVAIIANVRLDPIGEIPDADFNSANIGCVNPMFESLTLVGEPGEEDYYILKIAPDIPRQAGNLYLLHPGISEKIGSVAVGDEPYQIKEEDAPFPDINWGDIFPGLDFGEQTPETEGSA